MDNPGPLQLTYNDGPFAIAGAGILVGDWIEDLDGMLAAAIQARFAYGGAGTSATLYIQTSFDQGATPVDIAAIAFTTASAVDVVNLSALTPKTTPVVPAQQALTPGTCVDGLLGDRLRAVVVVAGTYTNSTLLDVRAVVR